MSSRYFPFHSAHLYKKLKNNGGQIFVPVSKAQLHTISWCRQTTPNLEDPSQMLIYTIYYSRRCQPTQKNHQCLCSQVSALLAQPVNWLTQQLNLKGRVSCPKVLVTRVSESKGLFFRKVPYFIKKKISASEHIPGVNS